MNIKPITRMRGSSPWVDAIIYPAQTLEALIWALDRAALNPEVKDSKPAYCKLETKGPKSYYS